MSPSNTLLKGGTVVTFTNGGSKEDASIYDADVLIKDGKIAKIEKHIHPEAGVDVVDCTGKWVTPGFVDTHRHTFMILFRGSQADYLLSEYIIKVSWSVNPATTVEEIRIGQLAGCLEALQNGVTTIVDHFHAAVSEAHVDAALESTIASGARVLFCMARQSPPTSINPLEFGEEAEARKWQLAKMKSLGKNEGRLTDDGRVTLGLAYDFFTPDAKSHQEVIELARSIPVSVITTHSVPGFGPPNIQGWRDMGIIGRDVLFSHANALWHGRENPKDELWSIMTEHNAAIASTPEDELGMAHGNPVAMDALDRGVRCGLGADCLSINSGDMFTAMRFALQFSRGRLNEINYHAGVKPLHVKHHSGHAFRMGTLGGAEAVNMENRIGSIEVGKQADIVVYDTLSPNLAGCLDPVQGIVFHASNADVEHVLVDGEFVKRDSVLTKFQWTQVAKELVEGSKAMRGRWPTKNLEEKWKAYHTGSQGH